MNNFESNASTAVSFLFLKRFKLPDDYFDKRAENLEKLSISDVQAAVQKVLHSNKMIMLRAGRVGKE